MTKVTQIVTLSGMLTLEQYMRENNLTDQGFADLIGRSRMQVIRYRKGVQMPRRKVMEKIEEVTKGQVGPSSFYSPQNA